MPAPTRSTVTSTVTPDNRPAVPAFSRWISFSKVVRRETIIGWLFVAPALLMYAFFVLVPLLLTIVYSFYRWNGVGPMTWVGLKNYVTVFEVPDLLGTIVNAFWLVIWFSFIPVTLGLVVASVIHRVATGRLGEISRAWLGDFDWALPSVGIIGVWVLLGFCTVLVSTGMAKVDPALYESARIDGAGWFQEFLAITVPLLRHEIGVCLTVTVIAALAA